MCSPDVMMKVHSACRRSKHSVSRRRFMAGVGSLAAAGAIMPMRAAEQEATPVGPAAATPVAGPTTISYQTIASLSHSLEPGSPVWPGRAPFQIETSTTVAADGFYANTLSYHEHVGTHLDAPAHFIEGGETTDGIGPERLVAPLAVLDVTAQAAADDDYAVSVDDLLAWEAEYGPLPDGAFVAFTSGWDARFSDAEAFVNLDAQGVQHYPGFHPDAAAFLVEERTIVGIGSDTLSQDPGNSTDFGTHLTILGAGLYGVEGVANLGGVPASGATVIVGATNHVGGSGGLARLLALF